MTYLEDTAHIHKYVPAHRQTDIDACCCIYFIVVVAIERCAERDSLLERGGIERETGIRVLQVIWPRCSYTTTRQRDGTVCGVRRLREKQEVVIAIGEVEREVDADLTCPGFEVLKRWWSTTT
jgi:hypothetical protein